MRKFGASKEQLVGQPAHPEGLYEFRIDGFKPKKTKKVGSDSINLNPQLTIIDHPTLNGKKIFFSLNTNAAFLWTEFVHSLGLELVEENGEFNLPGVFNPDPSSPDDESKMTYEGPMLGRRGRLMLAVKKDEKGRDQNYPKQFFCQVQGCTFEHQTELK